MSEMANVGNVDKSEAAEAPNDQSTNEFQEMQLGDAGDTELLGVAGEVAAGGIEPRKQKGKKEKRLGIDSPSVVDPKKTKKNHGTHEMPEGGSHQTTEDELELDAGEDYTGPVVEGSTFPRAKNKLRKSTDWPVGDVNKMNYFEQLLVHG